MTVFEVYTLFKKDGEELLKSNWKEDDGCGGDGVIGLIGWNEWTDPVTMRLWHDLINNLNHISLVDTKVIKTFINLVRSSKNLPDIFQINILTLEMIFGV